MIPDSRDLQARMSPAELLGIDFKIASTVDAPRLVNQRTCVLDELFKLSPYQCTCLSTKYATVHTEQSLLDRLLLLRHKLSDDTLQQVHNDCHNRV